MRNKIGRNQPCPCGSGLKYKRCCGRIRNADIASTPMPKIDSRNIWERHRADERIRETQQGLGRPIISTKFQGHQVVAVGNKLYFSKKWKTVIDFLGDYIIKILGSDWGNSEIAKPLEERHTIMQWYDALCKYQRETIKKPGEVYSFTVTGLVACYLGLAYNLYLLDHNVELQTRLVRRLKDQANFQGAYYELIIAGILICAGFTLTLEDETDPKLKHCEFAAISKKTGKKYWVEAKMKSVDGLLGKKKEKGGSTNQNPISRLIPHLNAALAKPANDERLIFIDLNAELEFDDNHKPTWHDKAISRLERFEVEELKSGITAYLFVTNMAFHRRLTVPVAIAAAPFGLGMPDFNRPGYYRLSDIYRRKQKHIDAYCICDFLVQYPHFPTTFDGKLPSEVFGQSSRIIIGETYFFEDVGDDGLMATVTSATVDEIKKLIYIGTDKGQILTRPMSDAELDDYKAHPDAYFGQIVPVTKKVEDRYAFFEWLMESQKGMSRETILKHFANAPDFEHLKNLNDTDLLMEYCERLASSAPIAFKTDEKSGIKKNI
jgi:hypothetical protein